MLLAGGQGSRLGALTRRNAKPAVSFGGKYRIIDFSLSNCTNSGIETVGVLTQYRPTILNAYLGTGQAWDLASQEGGVHVLPPYATETGGSWYEGTADAIYHNIDFIDAHEPEYVLILSGDHLYKMDYNKMLQFHKANNADLTVSVIQVPWEEASRFGIMTVDDNHQIVRFSEKPKNPDSNLASIGAALRFVYPETQNALELHTPIGSKLVFEKWSDGTDDYVAVNLVYAQYHQLQNRTLLSLEETPMVMPVTVEGLKANADGLYRLEDLDSRMAEAMSEYDAIEDTPTTIPSAPARAVTFSEDSAYTLGGIPATDASTGVVIKNRQKIIKSK